MNSLDGTTRPPRAAEHMPLDCPGLPDVAGLLQQARVYGPAVDNSACSGDGKGRIGRTVITVKQADHRAPEERTAECDRLCGVYSHLKGIAALRRDRRGGHKKKIWGSSTSIVGGSIATTGNGRRSRGLRRWCNTSTRGPDRCRDRRCSRRILAGKRGFPRSDVRSAEVPGRSCWFTEASSLRNRCSAAFQRRSFSMRVLHDTGRNAPIAKTLDCDLGFFARYLANPRARGDAAMNLEPQSLRGCLAVGGNDNVDEIGHADLTIPDVVRELPCGHRIGSNAITSNCDHARWSLYRRHPHKNPL